MKNLVLILLLIPFLFAGSFQSYTEKNPAESSDIILILDNDDLTTKKVQVGNLPGASINWDTANIQSGGINWIDLGDEVQARNINWTSLDQDIQKENVNWTSLDESVQSSGINWDSSVFSIDSNGNVGIGTLAPRGRLAIFGGKLLIDSGSAIRMKRANGSPVDVFSDIADSDTTRLLLKQNNSGLDNRLDVTTSGGTIIASFMNQSSGKVNVGIGTSVPTGRLEIIGNSADYPLIVTSAVGSSAGDFLLIKSDGNVGIGTLLPTADLQVQGTFAVRGASASAWSVKTGANTACDTTCGTSACAFGVDDTDKLPLACSASTADTCVCMGP